MKKYSHNFYKDRHKGTVFAANKILQMVKDVLPEINSAVDFGCGVGTWLSVIKEMGATKIKGYDGPWVNQSLLEIPKEDFQQANLEETIDLKKEFDLAISLEVAEHIHPENAGNFVDSLINASDFVLFSAAIPFQGGTNHVNEQWPSYWAEIFTGKGYETIDYIRMTTWNDDDIPAWYRQNILMFVKKERLNQVKIDNIEHYMMTPPMAMVHPSIYYSRINKLTTAKGGLKSFLRAIFNKKKKFN